LSVDQAQPSRVEIAGLEAGFQLPSVSVIVPTLNEAMNLEHVFNRMPNDLYEVILVDGNSVDDTVEVAKRLRPDIKVVLQNRSGKGNALACGIAASTGDVVVLVDADGSTDAAEIPRYLAALTSGADYVKGSRFIAGGASHDITRIRRIGNWGLNRLVNVLFGTHYSDLCYGYNAFWRCVIPSFDLNVGEPGPRLWGDGFEIETLINVRVAQAGFAISEVASVEHARINGVSNLNAWSDGWRVLRTILRERCRSRQRDARPQPLSAPLQIILPDTAISLPVDLIDLADVSNAAATDAAVS
jgi:glycosyltransferase involved in cell wall biosynthesis